MINCLLSYRNIMSDLVYRIMLRIMIKAIISSGRYFVVLLLKT